MWPRQLAHLAHLILHLKVQTPPAKTLQKGPPLPVSCLLPSYNPHVCSCRALGATWTLP